MQLLLRKKSIRQVLTNVTQNFTQTDELSHFLMELIRPLLIKGDSIERIRSLLEGTWPSHPDFSLAIPLLAAIETLPSEVLKKDRFMMIEEITRSTKIDQKLVP
ncbi:MAG: hypothetical protein C5B49_08405 [Bdellovibrio sp.]|nr:MAG: hypothetical protein C5B49_08405 [Bdellovibrio sp.]